MAVGRDSPASINGLGELDVNGLGSLTDWAVPTLALSVPRLLVLLAVLAQLVAGLLWLPVTRRWLGGFGLVRRSWDRDRS